jgi:diaminopimelate decarboxylase
VGELAASEIAERFGTPAYAMDAEIVRGNFERMTSGIPYRPLEVFYSAKANPAVHLLRLIRGLGAQLDACSPGDLVFADAAGFTPDEISYTGHSMTDHELDLVAGSGVFLTVDSLDQLERVGRRDPGREIGVRLNCGIDAGFHAHVRAGARESKFGIHLDQFDHAVRLAERFKLALVGLHGHLGSDIQDPQPHLLLLEALLDAAERLPAVRSINLGGGFGTPFLAGDTEYDFAAFGAVASDRLATASAGRERPLTLRLEPGGYLVMDAGVLLTKVTELKPPTISNGVRTPFFAGTDTSHNHLVSAVIYETFHPIWVADRPDDRPAHNYHVVGNLMQSGDILAADRPLPELRVGDVLAIGKCGGYSACRAPNFNERPRPAEVLVDGGEAVLIRRAETASDMLATQCL